MNYFSYFSEIEEHFQRRRGTGLLLSTLDWALIETWREAGIPLEAALRGIDAAFDKRDAHPGRKRQRAVNGLAWCSQAVMEAAEQMTEAAVGTNSGVDGEDGAAAKQQDGFDRARVTQHLQLCRLQIESARVPALAECLSRLDEIAAEAADPARSLESLETRLAMLEEKVFAVLLASAPDDELVRLREQSSRELAPYRSRMQAAQLQQVERQFLQKSMLAAHSLPRLSLFYMSHD